jgi:hypothetical protein
MGNHHGQVELAFETAKRTSLRIWLTEKQLRFVDPSAHDKPVGAVPKETLHVLSSDLTAASDLLPLDIVESLVNGFMDGTKWLREDGKLSVTSELTL